MVQFRKKAICTSPIEYCMVTASNRIYKCVAHCIDNQKSYPLKEYRKFFKLENELCNHVSCLDRDCDTYFVQIWNDENNEIISNKIIWKDPSSNIEEAKKKKDFMVHLEPVLGCPNKCPYCQVGICDDLHKISKFLDIDLFCKFLEYISDNFSGSKKLNICGGGEPLTHPQLNNDFISFCKEKDIEILLHTSGIVNSNEIFKTEDLSHVTIDISLHPLSPNWNEDKIIKLIKFFREKNAKRISGKIILYPENLKFMNRLEEITQQNNIPLLKLPFIDNSTISDEIQKIKNDV